MERPPPDESGASTPAAGSAGLERQLRHKGLAARTVAVSFRAAMESAERHLNVPADERTEIKARWRAWAMATLEGYASELEAMTSGEPITEDGDTEALKRYRDELERAFEMVRSTRDDG